MADILLIEPDRQLGTTYAQALADAGHRVVAAATAQTAIQAADEQRPEIVIVELQLVEHSGIEFLYEFRSYSEWQAIPITILSQIPRGEFGDNLSLLHTQLNIQT